MRQAGPSIFVLLGGAACLTLAALSALAQSDEAVVPTISVATVEERPILEVIPVSGTVRPRNEVQITPQLGGVQIRQVLVDVGDWVNAGDTLIRLQPDLLQAQARQAEAEVARADAAISQARNQISSAEASVVQAETELDRVRRLLDRGSTTQSAYDQALERAEAARAAAASARDGLLSVQAAKVQAESQQEIAQLNLRWTDIVAPVTGVVGAARRPGGRADHDGRGAADDGLRGRDAGAVGGGHRDGARRASSRGTAAPSRWRGWARWWRWCAALRRPSMPPPGWARCRFRSRAMTTCAPGSSAGGEIETERRMALAVPITAVLSDGDGHYVQVVDGNQISRRNVTTGLIWQGMQEIVDGLTAGEVVAARAGAFFRDGDQVRPVEADAGADAGAEP